MKTLTPSDIYYELIDEIGDISCQLKMIQFVQEAMCEDKHNCTPAFLIQQPLLNIQQTLQKIENFLETQR